ncbi:hypothetical protein ACEWY4_002528 [Coilia grayii]|uniref:RecQ-mediated genome instability protein 2 n=1 Tax=Coilia grayii TaxID=363190 RepID=A0ABD1KNR3_9TELE
MATAQKSVLEKSRSPPIKVLSGQLRDAKSRLGLGGKSEFSIKRLGQGKDSPLILSVVWMQGTVVEVQRDHNTVVLLDETGNFVVVGVNNIPKGKPCLIHGKYVMVMGLIQTHSPEPVLRAVKMADLSDNSTIRKRMWKYEVEDLQQYLP